MSNGAMFAVVDHVYRLVYMWSMQIVLHKLVENGMLSPSRIQDDVNKRLTDKCYMLKTSDVSG